MGEERLPAFSLRRYFRGKMLDCLEVLESKNVSQKPLLELYCRTRVISPFWKGNRGWRVGAWGRRFWTFLGTGSSHPRSVRGCPGLGMSEHRCGVGGQHGHRNTTFPSRLLHRLQGMRVGDQSVSTPTLYLKFADLLVLPVVQGSTLCFYATSLNIKQSAYRVPSLWESSFWWAIKVQTKT